MTYIGTFGASVWLFSLLKNFNFSFITYEKRYSPLKLFSSLFLYVGQIVAFSPSKAKLWANENIQFFLANEVGHIYWTTHIPGSSSLLFITWKKTSTSFLIFMLCISFSMSRQIKQVTSLILNYLATNMIGATCLPQRFKY